MRTPPLATATTPDDDAAVRGWVHPGDEREVAFSDVLTADVAEAFRLWQAACDHARETGGRRAVARRPAPAHSPLLRVGTLRGPPAVHRQHHPGDEAGLVGQQVRHRVGDLRGLADPAERV
jgi:hypothetical protein